MSTLTSKKCSHPENRRGFDTGIEWCIDCQAIMDEKGNFVYQTAEATDAPQVLSASAECPLCGHEGPHPHTPLEQVIYRNGVKAGKAHGNETCDVQALLTVQQENKRLRGALAAIEVGTPDLLPPYRAMGAKQLQEIAAKALRPAQKASEPLPCEHLRSEWLGEKRYGSEPLFEMRKCLDCTKIFRVRKSAGKPE